MHKKYYLYKNVIYFFKHELQLKKETANVLAY